MPVSTYRLAMIDGIGLLLLFVLAFLALTVLGRPAWSALRPRESLVGRLAGAAVLAMVGLAGLNGLNGLAFNILFSTPFSPASVVSHDAIERARTQALVGILLALGLAMIAVIRIEMYHRRVTAPGVREEDELWKVEAPERLKGTR